MQPRENATVQIPERRVVSPWQFWFRSKQPVFWFCGKFGLLLLLYYCLSLMPFYDPAMERYLVASAGVSHHILTLMGEACHITDATIWSKGHAISVLPSCSAVELVWFFCAAVVAFPFPWIRKAAGILAGVPLLLLLNVLRIVSLYYAEVHFHEHFDAIHDEFWPTALILSTLLICSGWIRWARHEKPLKTDVAA